MATAVKKKVTPAVDVTPTGYGPSNSKGRSKKPALKAVPKPAAKATLVRHKFGELSVIKVVGDKIPVREGSRRAEIFALFKDGMLLNEFLASARKIRGGAPDVQIALDKKYIELV